MKPNKLKVKIQSFIYILNIIIILNNKLNFKLNNKTVKYQIKIKIK